MIYANMIFFYTQHQIRLPVSGFFKLLKELNHLDGNDFHGNIETTIILHSDV